MNYLQIKLDMLSTQLRFSSSLDKETNIIEVTSDSSSQWIYGIDIDGTAIFDLDKERKLVNFDLRLPRKYWKVNSLLQKPDQISQKANLIFTPDSCKKKSFSMDISLTSDPFYSLLQVTFGSKSHWDDVVMLSSNFLALVASDKLVGFFIDMD